MRGRQAFLRIALGSLLAWAPIHVVCAQTDARAAIDAAIGSKLRERWDAVLAEVAGSAGLRVEQGHLTGTREQKAAAYSQVLDRLDEDLGSELERLVTREYVQALVDERVESRMASSFNAASTNPATAGLAERSGSTSLAALAADVSSLVSADKTAISLNVSALAFVSLKDPDLYSELANYQRHDFARRFSGTIVTGAKIPEKEITGLSNLPDFDKILDAFSWDVKVRVLGDKDPRSRRWSPLTVVRGGLLTQKAALITSFVGGSPASVEDALILSQLLASRLGQDLADMKARMARSPQLSVKTAGTHLTKEPGRNKYAVAALFDAGIGPADLTANAQYAVTNDISAGAAVFAAKTWTLAGEITSHLASGGFLAGRSLDWSLGGSALLFVDTASIPVPASNTWKVFSTFAFPIRGGGRIPVSVIYSNDPNAVAKERFVSGLIGISYDFSALKQLFSQ